MDNLNLTNPSYIQESSSNAFVNLIKKFVDNLPKLFHNRALLMFNYNCITYYTVCYNSRYFDNTPYPPSFCWDFILSLMIMWDL